MTGINNDYIRAYTEVNCLLKYLPQSYVDKIPNKLKQLIETQSDEEYNINIDSNKSLLEQNFSNKTKNLIAVIKYNYWSTDEEREKLKSIFIKNEKKFQNELSKKYSYEDLFKNDKKSISDNQLMVEYKEKSFIQKIFAKIKHLFKKN